MSNGARILPTLPAKLLIALVVHLIEVGESSLFHTIIHCQAADTANFPMMLNVIIAVLLSETKHHIHTATNLDLSEYNAEYNFISSHT